MNKKSTSRIISILLAFMYCFSGNVASAEEAGAEKKLSVDARCAIAMDCNTRIPLYEKNSQMLVPIASTTKIMTALVVLRYGDLDKKVEISKNATSIRGSTVGYKKGEMITLRELLHGLMLRSGNDAAIAIAEGMCGSVPEFVNLMNEHALALGLVNTHFETPHGLDSANHYSTAYELAYLTCEAKKHPEFNEIVGSKDVKAEDKNFTRSYHNINKILWTLPSATGVKTGYTGQAGKCLVTSATMQGKEIVIVVLNCTPRWNETKKIYDHVNGSHAYQNYAKKGQTMGEVVTSNGIISLVSTKDIDVPVKQGVNYELKVVKPKEVDKSVWKGDAIGSIRIYGNGQLLYSDSLEAGNTVKLNWFERMLKR